MPFRRKLASFFRLSAADRLLACEAIVFLGMARVAVLILPFRFVAKWLERAPDSGTCDVMLVRRIGKAVTVAARNVPWNAVCLPQAIAAKAMLARRGHGSAFHLGAAIEPGGKLGAHAWLACGDVIVIGASGMAGVAPLARFG